MTASLPDLEAAGGRLLATVIPSLRKGKATIAPGMTESTAPFVSCLRRVRKINSRNRPSSQAYALSLWACPASIFSLSLWAGSASIFSLSPWERAGGEGPLLPREHAAPARSPACVSRRNPGPCRRTSPLCPDNPSPHPSPARGEGVAAEAQAGKSVRGLSSQEKKGIPLPPGHPFFPPPKGTEKTEDAQEGHRGGCPSRRSPLSFPPVVSGNPSPEGGGRGRGNTEKVRGGRERGPSCSLSPCGRRPG